jgi:hypothetical protein
MYTFAQKNKLFLLIVLIGLIFRIWLVLKMPLWGDEAFSVWAGQQSVGRIIYTVIDTSHPPGFHLALHFLELISTNLYWLRLFVLLFYLINTVLIKKVAEKLTSPDKSILLVGLYVFSGYFVLFEWFIRMYVFVNTIIFLSVYLFINMTNSKSIKVGNWVFFTILNFVGLYVDYSYFWYFIPFTLVVGTYLFIKKHRILPFFASSAIPSILMFFSAYPQFIFNINAGFKGIMWARDFTNPVLSTPFFLGTVNNLLFAGVFLTLFVYGVFVLVKQKGKNKIIKFFLLASLVSYLFTYLYSIFVTPLFHLRSLQVVGISVIFIYFFGIRDVFIKKRYLFFGLFAVCYLVNFILVVKTVLNKPSDIFVYPFVWRDVLNKENLVGVKFVRYKVNEDKADMSVFALKYELEGKENVRRGAIPGSEYAESNGGKCLKFYSGSIDLYKCY